LLWFAEIASRVALQVAFRGARVVGDAARIPHYVFAKPDAVVAFGGELCRAIRNTNGVRRPIGLLANSVLAA
jgi:hypothetical protein